MVSNNSNSFNDLFIKKLSKKTNKNKQNYKFKIYLLKKKLKTVENRFNFSFITLGFKWQYYYWEIVRLYVRTFCSLFINMYNT